MAYPPVRFRCCNCLCKIFSSIDKVRREVPIMFELLLALFILCILLLMDIIWLGHVHTLEIQELDQIHGSDLNRFRKQFDVQMHAIDSQHKQLGSDLESAHSEEVNRMKISHQQDLEKKINNIQEQLNSLLGMSKTYWEKHAEKHHVEFQFEAPKLDDDLPEER